jgi:acetoin utilization protein AcuB
MTPQPQTIRPGAPLEEARSLMEQKGIRHLPVTDEKGAVVGIVSERDLTLVMGLDGLNPARFVVMDVCHPRPYVVDPDTSLAVVAKEMATRHIGSAIVAGGGKLLGIFTTVDACRELAARLSSAG